MNSKMCVHSSRLAGIAGRLSKGRRERKWGGGTRPQVVNVKTAASDTWMLSLRFPSPHFALFSQDHLVHVYTTMHIFLPNMYLQPRYFWTRICLLESPTNPWQPQKTKKQKHPFCSPRNLTLLLHLLSSSNDSSSKTLLASLPELMFLSSLSWLGL